AATGVRPATAGADPAAAVARRRRRAALTPQPRARTMRGSPKAGGEGVAVERFVRDGGLTLCVEGFGAPADPALLLIAGNASSMDWWDDELCARLAAGGRYVVRYDPRDTGRSTQWPAGAPGYTGADLRGDVLRVLDGLGI